MIYGYARVSTKGQLKGNSLEEQTKQLREAGNCTVIVEEQFTGRTTDRPKLQSLIAKLEPGDMLVATKLDRLARNVTEGIELVRTLFKKKVKVLVLNIGLLEDTNMGNFFLTTLLAVAELERNLIRERTLEGKEIARSKKGFHEGRRPIAKERIEMAMQLLDGNNTYKEVAAKTGISIPTLSRYRREQREAELVAGMKIQGDD